MTKLLQVSQLQCCREAEPAITGALQRTFATRSARLLHRTPFGMSTMRALHAKLFSAGETELVTFVRYAAPLTRRIAMEAAERQAMIEPVKLKLIDLEQWLRRLEELDPDCVRIIELRYFAGLTIREVAIVLNIPVADILSQLRFAKAWLQARVRWSTHTPT